jgi:hypothetical protein
MKKLSLVLGLLIVMGLSGVAMGQEANVFTPWIGLRGSYQAVFQTDLFGINANVPDFNKDSYKGEGSFRVPRSRIGIEGSFAENLYFQVEFDGRNTARGRGVDLRVAFLRWEQKGDSSIHQIEAGALTTAFARPLSGTEFAFINYDICTVLDAYQYGLQYRGAFADDFVRFIASVNNGEGVGSHNVGMGFQYVARVEITPLGNTIKDITEGNTRFEAKKDGDPTFESTFNIPMLTIGLAGALDNKARSDDFGYTAEYFNSYHLLADVTFKFLGMSFFAQGVYNAYSRLEDGTYWGGVDRNVKESYGGFAQIGYNLKGILGREIEPMGKFEWWDDTIEEGYGPQSIRKSQFSVGVNYYIKGHDLKLNVEYRRVLSDDKIYAVRSPWENFLGFRITHKFKSGKIPLQGNNIVATPDKKATL